MQTSLSSLNKYTLLKVYQSMGLYECIKCCTWCAILDNGVVREIRQSFSSDLCMDIVLNKNIMTSGPNTMS